MQECNYKYEKIKEYDNVELAIKDLKDYVKNDCLYEEYLDNRNACFDFLEIESINRTKAIKKLLEAYKELKERLEMMENE